MAKIAVIKTGGKQYTVSEGDSISIEKIAGDTGKKVSFDEVLLIGDSNGKELTIGEPTVKGKKVEGEIKRQFKEKKIDVIKYKNKTRYRRKIGHRQPKTEVTITSIK